MARDALQQAFADVVLALARVFRRESKPNPFDEDYAPPQDWKHLREMRRAEVAARELEPFTDEELWDMGEDVPVPESRD